MTVAMLLIDWSCSQVSQCPGQSSDYIPLVWAVSPATAFPLFSPLHFWKLLCGLDSELQWDDHDHLCIFPEGYQCQDRL